MSCANIYVLTFTKLYTQTTPTPVNNIEETTEAKKKLVKTKKDEEKPNVPESEPLKPKESETKAKEPETKPKEAKVETSETKPQPTETKAKLGVKAPEIVEPSETARKPSLQKVPIRIYSKFTLIF